MFETTMAPLIWNSPTNSLAESETFACPTGLFLSSGSQSCFTMIPGNDPIVVHRQL